MRNLDCHQGTYPGFTSRLPGLDVIIPRYIVSYKFDSGFESYCPDH